MLDIFSKNPVFSGEKTGKNGKNRFWGAINIWEDE